MVINFFIDSDIVKLYCIHGIPLYGSVMHILCWYYDYLLFIAYIWIDKIYDSDDLPLTQMVLQQNIEVNNEGEDAEDKEYYENYKEMYDEVAKNLIKFVSVSLISTLCFFCAYEEGRKR